MDNNEKFANLLDRHFPDASFSMVRYSYILDNPEGKILLGFAEEASFPIQTYSNKWEIFSESCYASDLWDEDIIAMALGSINNWTELTPAESDIQLIGLSLFQHQISYYEEQLNIVPASKEEKNHLLISLTCIFTLM